MADSDQVIKKKKITYTASPEAINIAEMALKRLGFGSKANFANSQLLARTTVTKFFQGQPIQLQSFKRICEALKLDWREIALIPEEQLERLKEKDCTNSNTNEEVEKIQPLCRQVTVIDKQSKTRKAVIILKGDINSINNDLLVSLKLILENFSGDTIVITDIKEGSVILTVEVSQEGIKRLISRFKLGEISEVNGFPIEDVQILSINPNEVESNKHDDTVL
ncbi:TRADD-like N-terminal domain-containing protein [Nostoc sp. DSM 114161]|jgi:DNA-binding Xre family transcriptional regulator|uniref:hypothetical protein n=1 Tax=Nostoc sp. DSM 114161 TaxID=3440143 RepID=UPI004046507F